MLKLQISSTKSQINHKLQNPMTKTFTAVGPHCCTACLSLGKSQCGTNAGGHLVWDFEFRLLEFVCFWRLEFGIYKTEKRK